MDKMEIAQLRKLIKNVKSVHFIGVGGVSMSALAQIMHLRGCRVTGSDMNQNHATRHLEELGVTIYRGHDADHVGDAELVVYTAAIKPENCELRRARELELPTVERAVFLGAIMCEYQCPIGVAGTHGKTTTTSMLAQIFTQAGKNPTIMVGGNLPAIGGNLAVGGNQFMIFEACEYVDSFLNFFPKIAVILNIEEEHLDYFKDIDQIVASFRKFAAKTGPDGMVVALCDDENVARAVIEMENLVTCSLTTRNADFFADVLQSQNGYFEFTLYQKGKPLGNILLRVPGLHNVKDALAACATAISCGISFEDVAQGLSAFQGAGRRLEYRGEFDGVAVYDDYAHHPTEIQASLTAVKKLPYQKVYCVFQPHTYTRTKAFFKNFRYALQLADQVVVVDIYAAREKDDGQVSSKMLAEELDNGVYQPSFDEATAYIRQHAKPGDLVITMGAGDVYQVGNMLLKGSK